MSRIEVEGYLTRKKNTGILRALLGQIAFGILGKYPEFVATNLVKILGFHCAITHGNNEISIEKLVSIRRNRRNIETGEASKKRGTSDSDSKE